MSEIRPHERMKGTVWGQFTGDAAALGTHWIYDLDDLAKRFPGGIRGFEAPAPGHYHAGKQPGDQTHYGDAALVLLETIEQNGTFDHEAFGEAFVEAFSDENYAGYRDHATKETLANEAAVKPPSTYQNGADDDQLATVTCLAPVAALAFGESGLLNHIERLTRVRQNNDRAVAYAKAHAVILEALLQGAAAEDAARAVLTRLDRSGYPEYEEVREKVQAAIDARDEPVTPVTLRFGQSCPLAGSFPSALHAFLRHGNDFATCIAEILRAGGDNAGRAAMAGAWIGAAHGHRAVPRDWRRRLTAHTDIERFVQRFDR